MGEYYSQRAIRLIWDGDMFSAVLYSDLVTGACLHEVFIWVVVRVYNSHYGHQLLLGCGWDGEPFWFLFLWNIIIYPDCVVGP